MARNVAFGLEIRKRPKAEIKARVKELLELVHLDQFGDRYPSQLSGGQRQRMALARALAVQPEVLLLDEPFGALDAQVRKELRTWLRRLHDEVHVTTVFVTHDQEEAMDVADRIFVMAAGQVEQHGTPDELYERPANDFVMGFLGPVTKLHGDLVRPHDLDLTTTEEPGLRARPDHPYRAPRLRGAGRGRDRQRRGQDLDVDPGHPRAGDAARDPGRRRRLRAQGRQGAGVRNGGAGRRGGVIGVALFTGLAGTVGLVLRMSRLFLRTLRDAPADAEVASHQLLVRGGYVRRVASGIWSWLPLGKIVLDRVAGVVREEMDRIGGQEVLLPALLPKEPYARTGRWDEYGDLLFRLKDRRGGDYLLGPTHEELFTLLVKGEYSSYKDLPVTLYQVANKYRDEARPRSGILRGREFVMKDAYSFDIDDAGLAKSYELQREAYVRIFDRLGLDYRIVSAVSGAMGGSASEEFLAPTPVGEDTFVSCANCGYAANVEAVTFTPPGAAPAAAPEMQEVHTPDTPTIETLAAHLGIEPGADAEERPREDRRGAGRRGRTR